MVIGIELMDLLHNYLKKGEIVIELVLLVAIIVVAREFGVFDYTHVDGIELIGMALGIISLPIAFYVIHFRSPYP